MSKQNPRCLEYPYLFEPSTFIRYSHSGLFVSLYKIMDRQCLSDEVHEKVKIDGYDYSSEVFAASVPDEPSRPEWRDLYYCIERDIPHRRNAR